MRSPRRAHRRKLPSTNRRPQNSEHWPLGPDCEPANHFVPRQRAPAGCPCITPVRRHWRTLVRRPDAPWPAGGRYLAPAIERPSGSVRSDAAHRVWPVLPRTLAWQSSAAPLVRQIAIHLFRELGGACEGGEMDALLEQYLVPILLTAREKQCAARQCLEKPEVEVVAEPHIHHDCRTAHRTA